MQELAQMLTAAAAGAPVSANPLLERFSGSATTNAAAFLVDAHNKTPGNLTGYDCPDCLNRGYFMRLADRGTYHEEVMEFCHCRKIRQSMRDAEVSGLAGFAAEFTLESWQTPQNWQRGAKELAERFIAGHSRDHSKNQAGENPPGEWFFMGGQPGAGKTHLCAAVAGSLMRSGKTARYMLWRDEIVRLRSLVNDAQYAGEIGVFKDAGVLYIDDLFKTKRGDAPTVGDINIAFELINYRYINRGLITVISCEKSVDELLEIDEAIGSRIYQRTRNYCVVIPRDQRMNWRLCGGSVNP